MDEKNSKAVKTEQSAQEKRGVTVPPRSDFYQRLKDKSIALQKGK
jgi:hypothetical protein